MKTLVFGKNGQVATELQRQADVIALDRNIADLANPDGCAAAILREKPDVVINAAAYTAVDQAETEEDLATTINAEAPGAMARACAELGIPFLHISTDYVFEGGGDQPWSETDAVDPQNAYGRSKLKGEEAVTTAGGNSAILRTAWVFSAHGKNFVKTMLRLGETRDELTIVADQIGCPTSAVDIAATLLTMAQKMHEGQSGGIYHFGGQHPASWADFARAIFAGKDLSVTVKDIPTTDFPTPASRPLNSRLDCTAIERDFGIAAPQWCDSLAVVLNELEQSNDKA